MRVYATGITGVWITDQAMKLIDQLEKMVVKDADLDAVRATELKLAQLFDLRCRYGTKVVVGFRGDEFSFSALESYRDAVKARVRKLRFAKAPDRIIGESVKELEDLNEAIKLSMKTIVDLEERDGH